jgi:hypothetical protein
MMLAFRGMLIKWAYSIEDIRRMAIEAGWTEPRIEPLRRIQGLNDQVFSGEGLRHFEFS